MTAMQRFSHVLTAVDTHTGGEPTRIVTGGLPALRGASLVERREELRLHHDGLRRALVLEPRGHEAIVLAYLVAPVEARADAGVIFANDAGYLGGCGHGSIGIATMLVAQGIVAAREPETPVVLETPVGLVECAVRVEDGRPKAVRLRNVPAYVGARDLEVEVPGLGKVVVDVAWGGNWFAFVEAGRVGLTVEKERLPELMAAAMRVRTTLAGKGIRGRHPDGREEEIDHVKIHQPLAELPEDAVVGARDLTLCPGNAYDRSPCGTGTSAKLALLHARGEWTPGRDYVGESIVGSRFRARIVGETEVGGRPAVVPEIEGAAWITALQQFVIDPDDPFAFGIV